MALRLACEHPDIFAGVVSVSGLGFDDVANCRAFRDLPDIPVNVLAMNGVDDLIPAGESVSECVCVWSVLCYVLV